MCHRWVWWAACAQGRPLFAQHCCHWCQEKHCHYQCHWCHCLQEKQLPMLLHSVHWCQEKHYWKLLLQWLIIPHCYNLENWNSIQLYFVKTPSCVYELSTVKPWYNTFIFGVIVDAEIMVKLHGSEIAFSGGNCCWWEFLLVAIVVGENCFWWQLLLVTSKASIVRKFHVSSSLLTSLASAADWHVVLVCDKQTQPALEVTLGEMLTTGEIMVASCHQRRLGGMECFDTGGALAG